MGWKKEEEETRVMKNNKKKEKLRAMVGPVKFLMVEEKIQFDDGTGNWKGKVSGSFNSDKGADGYGYK